MATPSQVRVGKATVTVINLGDLEFKLRDILDPRSIPGSVPPELLDIPLSFPSQAVHIRSGDTSIVVDPGDFAYFAQSSPMYVRKDYVPEPTLVEQLRLAGVARQEVTHVLITHFHHDHLVGVTLPPREKGSITFPKARHYLGKADWDYSEVQEPLLDPLSIESLTIGAVSKLGLLELVQSELEITLGVTLIPAPGESPGHQIVKIQSEGESLYCVGDLYHHAIEVENPMCMSSWCDPVPHMETKSRFVQMALKENALMLAAHMPIGRINGEPSRPKFLPQPELLKGLAGIR